MTNGQKKELESILEFLPKPNQYPEITETDIQDYFDYTERGVKNRKIDQYSMDGFNALIQARRWRGVHVVMYEEGIKDMPLEVILEGASENTVKFLARAMFKGRYRDLILYVHKIVNVLK